MSKPTIHIVEVSPRDGLQSESTVVATADKLDLIRRASVAGLRRIETVSFVNPKRVPQMADSVAVMEAINGGQVVVDRSAVSCIGLVLNSRGLEAAVAAGVDEINFVVVVSDKFAIQNQGCDTDALIDQWHSVAPAAAAARLRTTVTLAASFGCPYEGEVSAERFASVVKRVAQLAPDELCLADSIGVAVPTDVRSRVDLARSILPATVTLRCHFHNTRNTGLANAVAAVEAGVTVLDSSLGGVGGCPFAPNATGNVPTEDLVYLLHRMGYETGVDLDMACETAAWLEGIVDHPVPGLLSKAGIFPARR